MKKILLIITVAIFPLLVQAQDAKTLFDSIPESVIPVLSSVNRADFIDFLASAMKAEVKNKFAGTSEMTDLTSDYIRIRTTSQSMWEMKVLSVNDSTQVICAVSTACAPVCDSDIRFYTTNWEELPTSDFISMPVMDDYFQLTDSARLDDYNTYRQKADMLLAKATLSKDAETLTFTFTVPEYIGEGETDDEEKIKDIESFLRSPLVYKWQPTSTGGYQFKREDAAN